MLRRLASFDAAAQHEHQCVRLLAFDEQRFADRQVALLEQRGEFLALGVPEIAEQRKRFQLGRAHGTILEKAPRRRSSGSLRPSSGNRNNIDASTSATFARSSSARSGSPGAPHEEVQHTRARKRAERFGKRSQGVGGLGHAATEQQEGPQRAMARQRPERREVRIGWHVNEFDAELVVDAQPRQRPERVGGDAVLHTRVRRQTGQTAQQREEGFGEARIARGHQQLGIAQGAVLAACAALPFPQAPHLRGSEQARVGRRYRRPLAHLDDAALHERLERAQHLVIRERSVVDDLAHL